MKIESLIKKPLQNNKLVRPNWKISSNRKKDLLWLDKNENIDPVLNKVIRKVYESVSNEALYGYSDNSYLYKNLSNFLNVKSENLILSYGSDGVIRSVFEIFINSKDKILLTNPTFQMYEVYSMIYNASKFLINYTYSDKGPLIKVENLIKHIELVKPKLFCLPNPDSPTGTVFFEDELLSIIKSCEKNNTIILIDEAYFPYCDVTAQKFINKYKNLIIARSFSKAWGLAGLRAGYAIAHQEIISNLHKIRPMYEMSSIAVEVIDKMINKYDDVIISVNSSKEGKFFFINEMKKLSYTSYTSYANFFHINFGKNSNIIHKNLLPYVLYKKEFDHPCLSVFSRFTSAPKELLQKLIPVIQK